MLARCATYTLDGIEARQVIVECDIRPGLPSFSIIGLSDTVARDLRETVRAALLNSGFQFPSQRVTVNIAPASLRISGPSTGLAVALAVLAASGQVSAEHVAGVSVYGELSLSGEIRPLAGTLAAAIAHTRTSGNTPFLHAGSPIDYELAPVTSRPIADLQDALSVAHDRHYDVCAIRPSPSPKADFSDVRGHEHAIFALTVAAAGGHHLLLRGAPGSGKTLLSRRLPSILPELTQSEQAEVAAIRDAAGLGRERERPFRAPHHTISAAGLVGGGSPLRPGEITLAHRGVLLLCDLAEYSRATLEALRDPLVAREVTLVRGQRAYRMPADFLLVATTTPCPCGHAGTDACSCDELTLSRWQRRLSAPLLDRISIIVDLPATVDLSATAVTSSDALRDRVCAARERRAHREHSSVAGHPNDQIARDTLSAAAQTALSDAYRAGLLSARGQDRVLQVARTIADLADQATVDSDAIQTALGLRGDLRINTTINV